MKILSGTLFEDIEYEFIPDSTSKEDQINGQIVFSEPLPSAEVQVPANVDLIETDLESRRIHCRLTDGPRIGEIDIKCDTREDSIRVLFAPGFKSVHQIIKGDLDEALVSIDEHFNGEWGFRNVCRRTINFDSFVTIFDDLSGSDNRFNHTQFRSMGGYFANRIKGDSPQSIHSIETLRERIQIVDESSNLRTVALPEVLGNKLGQNYYREDSIEKSIRKQLREERKQLREIGFNPTEYDPDWRTVVPACWMASLILDEGVEAAIEFVRSRPIPGDGEYDQFKKRAKQADEDAEVAWAKALTRVFDESDEFEHIASHYLQEVADNYREKEKFQPLLYAGALEIVPEYIPSYVKQNIEYNVEYTIGHNWRRDSAKERAKNAFERAKEVARGGQQSGHDFDPSLFIQAEANVAHETAKQNPSKWETLIDAGINNINYISEEHGVDDSWRRRQVNWLKNQK